MAESPNRQQQIDDQVLRFHLRLDRLGRITHLGPSLAKIIPGALGADLVDLLDSPPGAEPRPWFRSGAIQRITFVDPSFRLRGEFIADGGGWLFAAALDPIEAERLPELNLTMSDFGATDLTMELAMLQWARDTQIAETRSALDRLRSSVELSETLKTQTTTDFLTGIANRARFMHLLERAIERNQPVEVMMIDLDRFKSINDLHGHHMGDQVLCETANRLAAIAGAEAMAARLGGDEFVILIVTARHQTNLAAIGDRIAAEVSALNSASFTHDGVTIPFRLTIGRAHRTAESEAGALMRHADLAMYSARRTGSTSVGVFDPVAQQELTLRRSIVSDLETAIERGELRLHLQPIVSLSDSQPVAYEVLSRWKHPDHGHISPALFVEVAEQCNLVGHLDRHVIATAVREITERCADRQALPGLSVNLSAMSLSDEMVDFITGVLDMHRFPASSFTVEVTETASINDLERTIRVLERLSDHGVVIALDDFGTGFSSLTHLHLLPIGALKVDRSFVVEMLTSRRALEVVRSILHVAKSFDLPVVAEGIETLEQAMLLSNLGCQFGQGYWFARPAPIEDALQLRRAPGSAGSDSRLRALVGP